jgi:hypothetical protein
MRHAYRLIQYEKLEALNNQLALEHRIKEGAENLLNMRLTVSHQYDTSVRSVR